MTVVNPKSISGINSITMASGSDNLLTIHSNNTTERVRVNNSGDVIIGSGVTLSPDGDVFATGVCTATSFSGDGSSLTGIAATDNVRTGILDVAGVGTFRGDVNIPDKIIHLGDTNTAIRFPAADTISAETGGSERARIDSSGRLGIGTASGTRGLNVEGTGSAARVFFNDSSNHKAVEFGADSNGSFQSTIGDNPHLIYTNGTERARFTSSGIKLPSGNGIDFSSTDDGSGTMSSELFDDYEEGTWVPDARDGSLSYSTANYTKIGRMVYVSAYVHSFTDTSTNDQVTIQGLPFTVGVGGVTGGSVMYQYVSQAHVCTVYIATTGLKFYGGSTSNYDGIRYNELSSSHSFYLHAWYIN